ncbi:unnamed protein product [Closterium sp. Yama58-4]|nr:unnamed protein product [Closterium sp. Yama58-4]
MAATRMIASVAERAVASQGVSGPSLRQSSRCTSVAGARSVSFSQSCELTQSSRALFPAARKAGQRRSAGGAVRVVAQELRTEQKVKVTLGPYTNKAIKATAPRPKVAQETVDKALKAKLEKTHEFERTNFTGSGAKLGHTVKINFEGKYADGPQAGQVVKGTKAAGYELHLAARDDEPWKTFVEQIVKQGMGQEESKTFVLTFPADYKAKALAGVKAQFTVTVKEIGIKKEIEKDPRPVDVQRAEIEQQLLAVEERKSNDVLDAQIKAALLESSEADVEKVAASVTWAKFGERSLKEFKWNVLQEEVSRLEGIPFDQVPAFLRSQADITYTD